MKKQKTLLRVQLSVLISQRELLRLLRDKILLLKLRKSYKTLYRKKKYSDIQYSMKKIYLIKAKNLSDYKDIINQIK